MNKQNNAAEIIKYPDSQAINSMLKKQVSTNCDIFPLEDNYSHIHFICDLLVDPLNVSALHIKNTPHNMYRQLCNDIRNVFILNPDPYELNCVITKDTIPIAWLKLNGLENTDSVWISMLVVHRKYRNLGIGKFALNYAEKYALLTSRKNIYINTTVDNTAALSLYLKSGYKIVDKTDHTNEDGTQTGRYTLYKQI